jgi:hypothetical protein
VFHDPDAEFSMAKATEELSIAIRPAQVFSDSSGHYPLDVFALHLEVSETRVECPKKRGSLRVIVPEKISLSCVDIVQPTPVPAISAVGQSDIPLHIVKLKAFDKRRLGEEMATSI